ncbi:hypothetical protein GTY65_24225 [Streptomyces sp. SID8379]|uniref:hypothetical protein n=1 Tax=unclassified Streptomyces TaxID=2593676 RepID=UPI000374F0E6|nr:MULTISPECIES: hypothetical protein [unclassified Streptomyces]MYW67150.1 hypothetical protein [Streptomyces sp. SID8379]
MRYGLAIKALPQGRKPFGDDNEDEQNPDAPAAEISEDVPEPGATEDEPAADLAADPMADPAADPTAESPQESPTEGAADEEMPDGDTSDDSAAAGPQDDARPWSGDMYDEGDETDPASAFAAYKGAAGEEAWLDQAPDGTLTGWVRDTGGQVWRYTDPDVWAMDVDDAQMTRTHSQADGSSGQESAAAHGGQTPLFPPAPQS